MPLPVVWGSEPGREYAGPAIQRRCTLQTRHL